MNGIEIESLRVRFWRIRNDRVEELLVTKKSKAITRKRKKQWRK